MPYQTVGDVMTRKIVTVAEQDALENIDEGMNRLRFRHLPVVDRRGKLIGLLSHRDLLHASSSCLSDKEAEQNAVIKQLPVGRIMQHEVLTVQPEDPLVEAGKLMWASKIGCLPVVDAEGTLLGILTEADFIRLAVQLLGGDIKRDDVEELATKAL
ncbi:MAG TPA: CBS domain-containing protein [Polyangiaceae bacterium]|nr:CBS domain-containing protein [Polyangiaceae bacterium]